MNFEDIKCRYKQIKNYEDYYITEEGEVYSTRTGRLKKMKNKNPGREDKYLNMILCNDNGQKKHFLYTV